MYDVGNFQTQSVGPRRELRRIAKMRVGAARSWVTQQHRRILRSRCLRVREQ